MIEEKRKLQRSSIFLIVNFRNIRSLQQHSSGIIANLSQEGIVIESNSTHYAPGEILEILLKDPHSELSVSAEGIIVWRRDRWYKCELGIEFRQTTPWIKSEILALISSVNKLPAGSPSPEGVNSKLEVTGKDKKTEALYPVTSDGLTIKAVKNEGSIYRCALERKNTKKENSKIDGLSLNDNLKKELISSSDGIILKEPLDDNTKSKNRQLVVVLTVLSFILITAAALRFDFIKISLPSDIQTNQYIFSQETANRKDSSYTDGDQPNILGIKEPVGSFQISDKQAIDHASLIGNVKSHDNVQHQSLPVNEDMLQVNNLGATIIFDYNSDIINPEFHMKIENIREALYASPKSIVKIEGHADNTGPDMYNLDLSKRRALAVKKMLLQKGIENARINVAFWGESSPVSPNLTVSGRMKNRRVEILIASAIN